MITICTWIYNRRKVQYIIQCICLLNAKAASTNMVSHYFSKQYNAKRKTVLKFGINWKDTGKISLENFKQKLLKRNIITKFKKRWTAREKKIQNHNSGLPLRPSDRNNNVPLPDIRIFLRQATHWKTYWGANSKVLKPRALFTSLSWRQNDETLKGLQK